MRIRVSPQAMTKWFNKKYFFFKIFIFAYNNFFFHFLTFKLVIIYKNFLFNKSYVLKDNKGKSGIYRLVNKKRIKV